MSSPGQAFVTTSARPFRKVGARSSKCSRRPGKSTAVVSSETQVNTSEISIPTSDNSSISAYLAIPETLPSSKAGVVLLSDINGYAIDETREVANLLARNSLPTIVPDLFRGNPWPCRPQDDTYEAWRQSHPYDRVHADVASAVGALRERGFAQPLGLIGFCFGGGRLMHELSLADKGVNPAAAVAFYPTRFDPAATGSNATCPLLFVAGDQDPLVPESVLETLRDKLENENEGIEDYEMIVVEGAGHAFAHRPKTEVDEIDSMIFLQQAAEWLGEYLNN